MPQLTYEKEITIRYMGRRRDPPRIRTSRGRYRGRGALVFQWLRQHGGPAMPPSLAMRSQ
jgi:hypothetical protein